MFWLCLFGVKGLSIRFGFVYETLRWQDVSIACFCL